jgi:hypothetical protein
MEFPVKIHDLVILIHNTSKHDQSLRCKNNYFNNSANLANI